MYFAMTDAISKLALNKLYRECKAVDYPETKKKKKKKLVYTLPVASAASGIRCLPIKCPKTRSRPCTRALKPSSNSGVGN